MTRAIKVIFSCAFLVLLLITSGSESDPDSEVEGSIQVVKTVLANRESLSTGYDNIEVYLNSLVGTIVAEQVK